MAFISFQPHDHFDCPTWTGSDSTTTVNGMGFKPDSLWIKNYSGTGHPVLNNSIRGYRTKLDSIRKQCKRYNGSCS